jgi:hypothetical protein
MHGLIVGYDARLDRVYDGHCEEYGKEVKANKKIVKMRCSLLIVFKCFLRGGRFMNKYMSRRDFLKIAGLASGAGVLAACGPSETATEAPETVEEVVEAPPADEVITITFTGWGGTEEDEGVKAAVKYYEEQNPNRKVTWIQIPENYAEKIMAMTAAGTPPDTAFIYNTIIQQYAKDGLLMDITHLRLIRFGC